MKTYTYPIIPNDNIIYVFGSNTQGRHGKGSALLALKQFGAIYGKAIGLQGNSYGIVTKDISSYPYKQMSKEFIRTQILNLYDFANLNTSKLFYIAYKGEGTNLNGYTPQEMAELFSAKNIAENIIFEESFSKLIKHEQSRLFNIK